MSPSDSCSCLIRIDEISYNKIYLYRDLMTAPRCFVDGVTQPVQLLMTGTRATGHSAEAQFHQVSTMEQLKSHLDHQSHPHCLISICQRHSWGPLHITEPMFNFLVTKFGLGNSIRDLSSCFYDKYSNIESTVCTPFTVSRTGPVTEVAYSIRYPDFKPVSGQWSIRQTGIYQKFNTETCQSLIIILNPHPDSNFYQHVRDSIIRHPKDTQKHRFWIHEQLFHTYLPQWRLYNAYLERILIPIADITVTSFIEELSETDYRHLSDLAFLESRLVDIPILLSALEAVLEGLASLCQDRRYNIGTRVKGTARASQLQFEQFCRDCAAYSRVSNSLQQRSQKITQLLANILTFREQFNTKDQNNTMLHLNKSAVFITTLTLLYLPPSFVATFFGMNFFSLDEETNQIVVTSMIWVFMLCSVILTVGTFILYHFLLDRTFFSSFGKRFTNIKRLMGLRSTITTLETELILV